MNFGSIAKPLTELLKKDKFVYNDSATTTFHILKDALVTTPILASPDYDKPFIIDTDASGSGIGAVLMQQGHPIAYISKSLSPKHQAMCVYDRELLAIISGLITY